MPSHSFSARFTPVAVRRPARLLALMAACEGCVGRGRRGGRTRAGARLRADLALADFPFFTDLLQEA